MKIVISEIEFLGEVIGNCRIKLQLHIITKVADFKEEDLKITKGMRSCLELLNYAQNYIPNLGKLLSPLYAKTSPNGDKRLNKQDWDLIKQIKEKIQKLPELEIPPENCIIILEVDRCMDGWGGICKRKKAKYDSKNTEKICANTASYRDVISATDQLEAPPIGFAKSSDYQGSPSISAIIKQNNTQIQLLVQIAESLKEIHAELRAEGKRNAVITSLPEDLIEKLQALSLGPSKAQEKQGKLCVFQDPYKILKEEQEKLKKRLTKREAPTHTLEQQIDPQAQLQLSMQERASLVPAEVLYHSRRDDANHRVYVHISEEAILVIDGNQVDRSFIQEESFNQLQRSNMQYIHLGIVQAILATMEVDLTQGSQMVYVIPETMLTIGDFFRNIQISILTKGYESWQNGEPNLLITRGLVGRRLIQTGLSMEISWGTYGRIATRSSVEFKLGLDVGAGVIDSDYRGEIKILAFNHSNQNIYIHRGDYLELLAPSWDDEPTKSQTPNLPKEAAVVLVEESELPQTTLEQAHAGETSPGATILWSMETTPKYPDLEDDFLNHIHHLRQHQYGILMLLIQSYGPTHSQQKVMGRHLIYLRQAMK
ncbi:hypothetical protein ZIOFF_068134 [Zingiber officinale]|uniref:dUTP diphosphatase n=1 Tax=Zingiber officinale TaxID=94328 RepID=A0A8J5CD82_ZINOF|nr:hypothetical protein ZIOFF_068134 [Zingiber officinale]